MSAKNTTVRVLTPKEEVELFENNTYLDRVGGYQRSGFWSKAQEEYLVPIDGPPIGYIPNRGKRYRPSRIRRVRRG
jgi:hypothetical protein